MAHFAELDQNNLVLRVLVTDNNAPNEGLNWLMKNFGGTWVKTSYNTLGGQHLQGGTPLRKNFAGIGYTYDENRDAFIPPQNYPSWLLNEDTCLWEAPTPYPEDDKPYTWDEESLGWIEVPAE
jgi:hypothetical protein